MHYGSYITTNAIRGAIGSGLANTNAMIAAQGVGNNAAYICSTVNFDGFIGWYLPSLVLLLYSRDFF